MTMKKYSYKKMLETGEIPPEVQEVMDRVNMLFRAWKTKQVKDFEDNKESVKSHMVERRKIVPPNFKRFWKWYLQYCGENDFDLSREIEPPDFELYHRWEVEQMRPKSSPKEEIPDIQTVAFTLAIAYNKGKIPKKIFKSLKLYEYTKEKFKRNGKRPSDIAKHLIEGKNFEKAKADNPDIFEEAQILYKETYSQPE